MVKHDKLFLSNLCSILGWVVLSDMLQEVCMGTSLPYELEGLNLLRNQHALSHLACNTDLFDNSSISFHLFHFYQLAS